MEPILKGEGISVGYQQNTIIQEMDVQIPKGQITSIIGPNGCGKSTLGSTLLYLDEPTGGEILFEGTNLQSVGKKEFKRIRPRMQMIFQDPYASLNPRMTVGEIIREPMDIHHIFNTKEEREQRVRELLDIVGLKPDHIRRYPHEFSGGQRQRIGIARTLALNPQFIVCDEPISALDVSIQAQVINLLGAYPEGNGHFLSVYCA